MRTHTVVIISLLLAGFCSQASAQWVQTSLPYNDIRCLAASGTNLFVGTYGGGVFLSTNTDEDWQPANGNLTDTRVLALTMDGLHLFAGTHGEGIFFSTNNGTSWTAVNEGLANRHVTALAVARNGTDGTYLFAGVGSVGTASSGIFIIYHTYSL